MERIGIHAGTRVTAALITVALAIGSARVVTADEVEEGESQGLAVVATLGKNIKDTDFHEVTYFVLDGKRRSKKTALVKIPDTVPVLHDRPGKIEELEVGTVAWIFGKPEEREVVGNVGTVVGTERFIKGGRLLVSGAKASVAHDYKSPDPKEKDLEWCRVEVEKTGRGAALSVVHNGNPHRVTMEKGFRVIVREEVADDDAGRKLKKKLLRRGSVLVVQARPSAERPEGADADAEVYGATAIVVVQRAFAGYYGSMIALE